jgi:hypothetical protein
MTATTADGVEVEIHERAGVVYVCPAPDSCWARRETDHATVEAAAAWVSLLTWDEVRLGCL